MSERTYYVICDDNCRFEGLTKEQIYDAIAEATGSTPTSVDDAFITMIKEQNAQHSLKVWKGTEAQYNALATKSADTLYFVGTNRIVNLEDEIQPISRGGTGATTAADARTNLDVCKAPDSGHSVEQKKLLWTNASPTASFAAQTISLDLSDYDDICIIFKLTSSSIGTNIYQFLEVGKATYTQIILNVHSSGLMSVVSRAMSASLIGVTINDAYLRTITSTTTSTDNTQVIPYKIYGIKEV